MLSVAQSLDVAWQHYRSGRWQRAEQLYRIIAVTTVPSEGAENPTAKR